MRGRRRVRGVKLAHRALDGGAERVSGSGVRKAIVEVGMRMQREVDGIGWGRGWGRGWGW